MIVVSNPFGLLDYSITGDREEQASKEFGIKLNNMASLPYIKQEYLFADLADMRKAVAQKYNVTINFCI